MAVKISAQKSILRADAAQQLLAFAALIIMFVVFSIASPYFFQFDNIVGILMATSVIGLLSLGATFVIITGGIDLSVGTNMTLSAVMTGMFIVNWHMPILIGVLAGMGSGALIGFASGNLISRMKIPPFIATLGMMMVAKGMALVISQLKPIYFNDIPGFDTIAMGSIVPALQVPNAVLVLFACGHRRRAHPLQNHLGPL